MRCRPCASGCGSCTAHFGAESGMLGAALLALDGGGGMSGRLVVCPTPIGNLEDVTLRVLAALREADVVACEDTRRTRVLLDRYGVSGAARLLPRAQRAGARGGAGRAHARRATVALVSRTPACRSSRTRATCWCGPAWPPACRSRCCPGPRPRSRRSWRRGCRRPSGASRASSRARRASCEGLLASRAGRSWRSSRRGGCRRRWRLLAALDARARGGRLPRAHEGARGGRARDGGRAGRALRGRAAQGRGGAGAGADRGRGPAARTRRRSRRCGGWWTRAPSRARRRRSWRS